MRVQRDGVSTRPSTRNSHFARSTPRAAPSRSEAPAILGPGLAGREARRVVARVAHLLLGPAPEHAPTLDRVGATALQAASRPRDYVGVAGPDAAAYLQRMVSNDVEALGPGEACQALLLTAKARLIAPLDRPPARTPTTSSC